ncbi:MAG: MFS transporter [Alphaproteobacteria bacterium]
MLFSYGIVPFLLLFITAVSLVATDIYLPSLPSMSDALKCSEDMAQLTVSTFFAGSVVTAIITGGIIARFGYRSVMLWAVIFFAFTSLLLSLSPNIEFMQVVRFLQGLSRGTFIVLVYAIVREMFDSETTAKFIGIFGLAATLVPGFAPVLGGYIDVTLGWRYNFHAVTLLSAITLFMTWKYFKPAIQVQESSKTLKQTLQDYLHVGTNLQFLSYAMPPQLLYGVWFCMLTIFPFYFIEVIKMTPDVFGWYNAVLILVWGAGSYLSRYVFGLIGMEKTILLGLIVSTIGSLGLVVVHYIAPLSIPAIMTVACIHLLAYGVLYPPSATKALGIFDQHKGVASSLNATIMTLFCGLGALVAGFLDDFSLLPFAIFMCLVHAVCLGLNIFGTKAA